MMLQLFESTYPGLTIILVGLFSLLIGSFLNVLIYRLPLMLQEEWQACGAFDEKPLLSKRPFNLCFPRSFCPHCKTQIAAYHNIPLLSFLLLRGQCSHCNNHISARYPLVEALSAFLSIAALLTFHLTPWLIFALLFIWLSIGLAFIDWETFLLPDVLTLGLLWLGLIANTNGLFTSLTNAVWGAASAYLLLWGVMALYSVVKGKAGMGHGDFKLFAALGAWFGITKLPLILCFASTTGLLFGLCYLFQTKQSKETPLPFGPFIILAGLMVLFGVEKIIDFRIDNS